MPPTNATRSSITIVFSWWQCMKPVHPSSASVDLRVASQRSSISRTSRCDGLEERESALPSREHAHVDPLGQLGEEVAHDHRLLLARQLQLRREEPAREVDVRLGRRELLRDRGRTSEPSTRTSSVFPGRAGKPPRANPSSDAVSARSHPSMPQTQSMPPTHRAVDLPAQRMAELDSRAFEKPRCLGSARDRIGRPRGASRCYVVVTFWHAAALYLSCILLTHRPRGQSGHSRRFPRAPPTALTNSSPQAAAVRPPSSSSSITARKSIIAFRRFSVLWAPSTFRARRFSLDGGVRRDFLGSLHLTGVVDVPDPPSSQLWTVR